ncbi:MAG TPA: DUF3570 domain-containing protein [Burkholderiaceae bacterium]|nr:DUF3570 domain-containing protein [Burkholderiaceae bacterium]HQR69880.1 DUF3570 domain-containing protein [Burkholderiaceae bacterium]
MAATEPCWADRWRRGLRLAQRRLLVLGERRRDMRGLAFLSCAQLLGALGGLLATGDAGAADLPENRADLMLHSFSGGGVDAWGPALLVRKNISDKFSLLATYYADIVSNASIDVVTTASPYRETRNEFGFGVDYVVRDSVLTFAASRSTEPDYIANAFNVDVSTDTFSGMTTVGLGYTYGSDDVGKKGEGFFDHAKHWRYRLGVTQILSPRWLANANFEVVSDSGFLASPYRMALVFSAAVPERLPGTRTSRTMQVRVVGEVAPSWSVRAEYRYFWDTWDIQAQNFGVGAAHRIGEKWLVDAYARYYTQGGALYFSNNATTETQYVTRNRQLSPFSSWALGGKVTYALTGVPGKYEVFLNGALEYWNSNFSEFTDVRTGSLYSYTATVAQVFVTVLF